MLFTEYRHQVILFLYDEEIARKTVLRAQNGLILLSCSDVGAATGCF